MNLFLPQMYRSYICKIQLCSLLKSYQFISSGNISWLHGDNEERVFCFESFSYSKSTNFFAGSQGCKSLRQLASFGGVHSSTAFFCIEFKPICKGPAILQHQHQPKTGKKGYFFFNPTSNISYPCIWTNANLHLSLASQNVLQKLECLLIENVDEMIGA